MRISAIHIIIALSACAWAAPSSTATADSLNQRSGSNLNPRAPSGKGEDTPTRPSSPVPVLEEDDAEEDPEPEKPAYVAQVDDVEDVGNDEDYNKADQKEIQKIFKEKKTRDNERRQDLQRRNPVKFHAIKNAKNMLYYKAYAAQSPAKQRIFYGKKEGDDVKFYRSSNAEKHSGLGEMHIDHRLEIQRMKNLFKRDKPTNVEEAAWKKMQVATAETTNSDTNEDKKALAEVINDTANLRGLQEHPNYVKGKVSMYIDKKTMGKDTTSKGPDYAKSWARSHAFIAYEYLKATQKQYNTVAKSLATAVRNITKDEALEKFVITELKRLDKLDREALKEALDKPVEKDGVNFKEEDMKKPKV